VANRDAIREANLMIVAVPYQGHGELPAGLAAELASKIDGSSKSPERMSCHLAPIRIPAQDHCLQPQSTSSADVSEM
jgi:hypothetical protein